MTEETGLSRYKRIKNGRETILNYVLVVRRHQIMQVPRWMASSDVIGIDANGYIVLDAWHKDRIPVMMRSASDYVVAFDPDNPFMDIRLYWNPDTRVWIGLRTGAVRMAHTVPHRRGARRERIIQRNVEGHLKRRRTIAETLASRKAARAAGAQIEALG